MILSPGVDIEKFFNDKATGNGAPLHNGSKLRLALEELGFFLLKHVFSKRMIFVLLRFRLLLSLTLA